MAITTSRKLLSDAWTADVAAVQAALALFSADEATPNDCRVAFFEVVDDRHLHVNVTHTYPTKSVRGWAGPARLPDGYVHNRRFHVAPPGQIVRQVRDMVFAARI
jgi:hypothetical protein